MIICRAKWGRLLSSWAHDTTNLGLTMWADFSLPGKHLRVISTYFPTPTPTPTDESLSGSLFNRIKTYASIHSIPGNPTAISQHIVGKAILNFTSPGKSYMVCGDFNAPWSTSKPNSLSKWGSSLGLSHFLCQSRPPSSRPLHTFVYRRLDKEYFTHIDHILHRTSSFATPSFSVTLSGGDHSAHSDHLLSIQGFNLGPTYVPLKAALRQALPPDINLKDKSLLEQLAKFEAELLPTLPCPTTLTPAEASEQLLSLQTSIVSFLRRKRPPHSQHRSKYKNNWSPIFSSTTKHLSFLIEVRRHCNGQRRRFKWKSTDDTSKGIADLTSRWKASSCS